MQGSGQITARLPRGLTYGEKPLPSDNPPGDAFFFHDYPAGSRCLHGLKNPGGEVTWATCFELPASHLDELTPGEYTRIMVDAHPPKNQMGRKSSNFSCGGV